jgi:hypothetical protein
VSDPFLYELADIVRSKNAGPFLVTLDVFIRGEADYAHVKSSEVITKAAIAAAYGIDEDHVVGIYFWDPARAVKITLRRAVSSGAAGDDDVYGAAMHMPLMNLVISENGASRRAGPTQPGVARAAGEAAGARGDGPTDAAP